MELDQLIKVKSSIVFHREFSQLSKTILEAIMCHNKIVLYGSNVLVSVSKFHIDTTKNPWYRIDTEPCFPVWAN